MSLYSCSEIWVCMSVHVCVLNTVNVVVRSIYCTAHSRTELTKRNEIKWNGMNKERLQHISARTHIYKHEHTILLCCAILLLLLLLFPLVVLLPLICCLLLLLMLLLLLLLPLSFFSAHNIVCLAAYLLLNNCYRHRHCSEHTVRFRITLEYTTNSFDSLSDTRSHKHTYMQARISKHCMPCTNTHATQLQTLIHMYMHVRTHRERKTGKAMSAWNSNNRYLL